jgi:protein TonB
MRAADPVENSGTADAVRIDEPDPPHHPQPVYAGGADDAALATLSLEVDLRAWPSQLAQWLVVFAFLGLLIGGAKWWDRRPADGPDGLVASSAVTGPAPQAQTAAVGAGTPPAGSSSPTTASVMAPASDAPGIAAATRTARAPVPVGGGQRATEAATPSFRAPLVRAPSDVPYPRRIHDVQPQVPSNAAATRGIAVLSVLIDIAGNVAEVEILRSLNPALDAAATEAARQWKFEPTTRRGHPVAVRGNFTVRFGY